MVETLARTVGWAFSLVAVLAVVLLTYASRSVDDKAGVGSPIYPGSGPLPRGGGRYVVGKPYEIAGRRYSPAEQPQYDEVGIASWYGRQFHRRQTSNGEWFDMDYFTAAHTTLPLPSYVKVTNLANGIGLIVRLNDRGPFVGDRIIDLSRRAAQKLAFKEQGTAKVRVQYLGRAPLEDNGTHLAAMNRGLGNGLGEGEIIIAASGKKKRLVTASLASSNSESEAVRAAAPPLTLDQTRPGKVRSLISCDSAAAIVSGYAFTSVVTTSCSGLTYQFQAIREENTYSVMLNAKNGEIIKVEKIENAAAR